MKSENTLHAVVAVLNRYPGVSVKEFGFDGEKALVVFKCKQMAVLARLALWEEAANVVLRFRHDCTLKQGCGSRITRSNITFIFETVHKRPADGGITSLEGLGYFLVWDLYALKKLSTREANKILSVWGGGKVRKCQPAAGDHGPAAPAQHQP